MQTPLFPAWRARLAALGHRVQTLRAKPLPQLEKLFSHLLPAGLLSQADEGANSRDRIYSLRRTFWAFLWQALNPAAPCRGAVQQILALSCVTDEKSIDAGSSAYCQARARLPLSTLVRAREQAAEQAQKLLPQDLRQWRSWHPKVLDGTTLSLADTTQNQGAYPQSASQKPGCGFPLMRLVGVFSLATGALLGYAKGNQHAGELSLLFRLRERFAPRDLLLADRGFASYVVLALFDLMGVACLFRLHRARPHDLRQGQRLGKQDRLSVWRKPNEKPRYLPRSLWNRIPKELVVRVLRVELRVPGFRTQSVTLVTTLSDAGKYPAAELAQLYLQRWRIELWWRHLKTTMGMEVLRCLSPAMVHKELEMYLIGYNFIRCLITEAAVTHHQPVEQISFKGTVDAVRQFSPLIAQARTRKIQKRLSARLLQMLAEDLVPERPNRQEPRALKRRPKPFPLLTEPRHVYREIPHRSRYRKDVPDAKTHQKSRA